MWPLIDLFGWYVPSYNIFLVIGFFLGLAVLFLAARRKRVALDFLADHFVLLFIASLVMARLTNVLIRGYGLLDVPFFWRDTGFDMLGGLAGFLITLFILTRRHSEQFLLWLDLTVLAGLVTLFFHHLGTFASGEAYGSPTDTFWGIAFTNPDAAILTTLPIHPTQIYAAIITLIVFLTAAFIFKKEKTPGHAGAFILLIMAAEIFLIDFLRDDSAPTIWLLRFSQIFALGFASIAALFLYRLRHSKQALHETDLLSHSRRS